MPRRAANSKLALRGIWVATQALGLLSPRLAGRPASILWFTPWRLPQSEGSRAREREWLKGSKPFQVAGLKGFVAGDGPVILLVHGWGGWASRLGAFVRPLVEAGHQVVGMDLPAHGSSPGRRTNPFEMADALLKVAGSTGPVHALISHSFGGLVSLLAMERGLKPGAAVYLAPALRPDHVRARFAELFRLRPRVMDALVRVIDRRFGSQVWEELDGRRIAHRMASRDPDVPVLIAHDPEDRDALFSDALAMSQILPGGQTLSVAGAGHHRILVEESVVIAAVEFVTGLQPGTGDSSIPTPKAGVEIA
ncbi:MAG TPA: alpha/beta fold hydrolase [Actinomycetota bacterium]|nr:alpha/beta fold hydrolase [Actinomycetota bacterium]